MILVNSLIFLQDDEVCCSELGHNFLEIVFDFFAQLWYQKAFFSSFNFLCFVKLLLREQ